MWIMWKVIVCETCFSLKISGGLHNFIYFSKIFNFAPMLESRKVDHVKSNCPWDMFLWKNSGGLHSFMSFTKMFQFCTHARIMKCGSREKWLFVRHVFGKKFQADYTLSYIFQKYFNFVPKLESRNVDHMKSNCSWGMCLWKNSGGLHTFMSFSKIFQLCTHARITKCGSREKKLFVRHVFVNKFRRTTQFHEFFRNISILCLC